jgi:hypothetical protein
MDIPLQQVFAPLKTIYGVIVGNSSIDAARFGPELRSISETDQLGSACRSRSHDPGGTTISKTEAAIAPRNRRLACYQLRKNSALC